MEKLRIKLEKWVHGGYTLGHYEGHAVFVTGGLPGELVDIIIHKSGKKEWFGSVDNILEPSTDRIKTDCEVFNACGGCTYRHLSYQDELKVKKGLLAEAFPHESPMIEIISGPESFYRNNVQWQLDNGKVGFFAANSHIIIERSNAVCRNVDQKLLWSSLPDKQKQELLKGKFIMLRLSMGETIDYSKSSATEEIMNMRIRVPEKGFFQINKFLIHPWLEKMNDWLKEDSKVLELFCGCGTIGIALSKKIKKLWGLELDRGSINFAKQNVIDNNIKNYLYNIYDLNKKLLPGSVGEYNTWIMNPPRSGLSSSVLDSILSVRPEKIIYSSCNSSTLKRDVSQIKNIGYKINHMVLIDFFPRTMHYEILTQLERI